MIAVHILTEGGLKPTFRKLYVFSIIHEAIPPDKIRIDWTYSGSSEGHPTFRKVTILVIYPPPDKKFDLRMASAGGARDDAA